MASFRYRSRRFRYAPWNAARIAKRHAKSAPPIPDWNAQELPPYLREVKADVEGDLQIDARTWARQDAELLGSWQRSEVALRQGHNVLERAERDERTSRANVEDSNEETALITPNGRRRAYRLLLLGLFIAEFPINVVAFRLLGETEVLTYVASVLMALVLLPAAHMAGEILREWRATRWLRMGLAVAASASVIFGVAYLRSAYMMEEAGTGGLDDSRVYLCFLAFNLGVFATGLLASHRVHRVGLGDWSRAHARLVAARKHVDELELRVQTARTVREKAWDEIQASMHVQCAIAVQLAERYHEENHSRRPDRGHHQSTRYPLSHYAALEIVWPDSMRTLNWPLDDSAVKPARHRVPILSTEAQETLATGNGVVEVPAESVAIAPHHSVVTQSNGSLATERRHGIE